MYYIGLMSGTSMDAIDTVLVKFENNTIDIIAYEQYPIDDDIRQAVRKLSAASSIDEISAYDFILGHLFADAVLKIISCVDIPAEKISAVGSHGQTILHLPDAEQPRTLQIGDANIIASKTGITTIADFRRMDMAAGGQGAPLAPAFHAHYFRPEKDERVILNIGGIANITLLTTAPDTGVIGFDTGPGNGLLDDWNRQIHGTGFDRDGSWAAGGNPDQELLSHFLNDPFFSLPPPKSTGRDYFNLGWLQHKLTQLGKTVSDTDIQTSLLHLSAQSIANAIREHASNCKEIFVCGGGIHNVHLMKCLKSLLPKTKIESTEIVGINPDAVEALTFAWLAKQRLEGKPGNLPSVTGARKNVLLGAIFSPY